MKYFSFLFINFLYCFSSVAQESKVFTIHAGSSIYEGLPPHELYLYPAFTEGQVYFQNGVSHSAKLNYNYFFGLMQFIDGKGDTLNIAGANTIKHIAIATDTFYYDKEYLQQLKSNNFFKLAAGEKIRVLDRQRIGGFGQPTSTGSINIYDRYANSHLLFKLTLQENLLLLKEKKFFLADTSNRFIPLNKKSVFKLFPYHEYQISTYLEERRVNFNKQEDVVRLAEFLFTLKRRK